VVLALGGASWPQLGSNGAWVPWLKERGVGIAPWQSANCGFNVSWSKHIREKFAWCPLKSVAVKFTDISGKCVEKQGEMLISDYGIEGSLVYSFSKSFRECINNSGKATFYLDLLPQKDFERVLRELEKPRGSKSLSRHWQGLGLTGLKAALLYEIVPREKLQNPRELAQLVKALPITIDSTRPLEESISTAGGVCFDSIDERLMIKSMPGIFVAGEMLDWEAPTGGYLLTGCFATGYQAGKSVKEWLRQSEASK
jgi:uncharacterized flavoprotein (TIGR03862 family)